MNRSDIIDLLVENIKDNENKKLESLQKRYDKAMNYQQNLQRRIENLQSDVNLLSNSVRAVRYDYYCLTSDLSNNKINFIDYLSSSDEKIELMIEKGDEK